MKILAFHTHRMKLYKICLHGGLCSDSHIYAAMWLHKQEYINACTAYQLLHIASFLHTGSHLYITDE